MNIIAEDLLHCSILFSDPRVLSCQHTFCQSCLTSFIDGKRNGSTTVLLEFGCPLCRITISLEGSTYSGSSFPPNRVLAAILDIQRSNANNEERISTCDGATQTFQNETFNKTRHTQTAKLHKTEASVLTIQLLKQNPATKKYKL